MDEPPDTKGSVATARVCCVVIFACAVDAADKAMLPGTFKAMAEQMEVGPAALGKLSFAQSMAFSLALPVWGSLIYSCSPRDLLSVGCILWGSFTLMASWSSSFAAHFVLRLFIGASLAVVMPIGQSIICDLFSQYHRGTAFGIMSSMCAVVAKLSIYVTTAYARTDVAGVRGWRVIFAAMALLSIFTGLLVRYEVPEELSMPRDKGRSWFQEQQRVLRTVARKPSFYFMVLQGILGATPWHAFAFLPFFLQLCGYSDAEAAMILLYGGFGGLLGHTLGGYLGDRLHRVWPYSGRIVVAVASKVVGTTIFGLFMVSAPHSASWKLVVLYIGFHLTATWTQSCALRPMCGDLVKNSQDRAQILALWIALEGIISSICGAPLAGALAEAFGYSLKEPAGGNQNVTALQHALLWLSMLPWSLTLCAWMPLFYTYPRDAGHSMKTFSA